MDRFTISPNEDLARQFDELVHKKGYQNRSEAVRNMLRNETRACAAGAPGVALLRGFAFQCVQNHHAHDLTERLTNLQHEHHQLVLSPMHVHTRPRA